MADRTSRAVHIAIDGRELLGQPTGVGRYLLEVLRVWAHDTAVQHQLSVVVPDHPPASLAAELGSRVSWVVVPGGRGTVWEQWHLPRALRRLGSDVLFAAAYTAPILVPCPFVVAIYDVWYFAHPEWFGRREGARRRWVTRVAAARAATIVTISAFSAQEIARCCHVPSSRIALAPPGASPIIPSAPTGSSLVLFVGSIFQRRHIPELIRGFSQVAADWPDARLVIVGHNRTVPPIDLARIAADAGVARQVEWRAYVTDSELDALYRSARVFAFLSDYEGFAMTPLEALAHGVPSVLLDTPVAHEVYGDAACFASTAPESIAGGLRLLLQDSPTRQAVLDAGQHRLAAYSWTTTAGTVRAALERAVTAPEPDTA